MINNRRAADNAKVIRQLDQLQYPNLHKLLNRRRGGLINNLLYVLDKSKHAEHLQFEEYGGASFYQSIEYFTLDEQSKGVNRAIQTWHTKLILMALIGLIKRVKPRHGTGNEFKKASLRAQNIWQKKTGRMADTISYWYFDKYTDQQLAYCEASAKKWFDSKATLAKFSKETAITVFGQDRANAVYQDKRMITQLSHMAYICICKAIESMMGKGYVYPDEALIVAGNNLFYKLDRPPDIEKQMDLQVRAANRVTRVWQQHKHSILAEGGNKYARPTLADKAALGIDPKNNRWIITKNEHAGGDK